MIWNSSTTKSLRKQGSSVAADASSRLVNDPWKNSSSVSTDKAEAPFLANWLAKEPTGKEPRRTPFEGEAFLSSAIMAGPTCDMAASLLRNPRGEWLPAFSSRTRLSVSALDRATQ